MRLVRVRRQAGACLGIALLVSISLNLYFLCLWATSTDGGRNGAGSLRIATPGRALSPAVDTAGQRNSTEGNRHAGRHEGPHQYDALLFLFTAFLVGAAIMHILMRWPKTFQETVVLFVIGVLYSLVLEGLHLKDRMGVFGNSYEMWMGINPHLLLFTLLPVLLAGDAMTIDMSIIKDVAYQCIYLAGPGVLLNTALVALFLQAYLGWNERREDLLLSVVTGAILCATDPVAVVALLKELGASPKLTVQIQGESLLNDGTAMVLYMISYDMLKGIQYDYIDVAMFVVKTALMAWGLGMFIGYFFFTWIRLAGNKFVHTSSTIQIALTLCCAYCSFIFAEGVFHISGVLSTVAASFVLAKEMWPHVVCRESLSTVWHTLEALGNILVFFLAGALTGNVMVKIEAVAYLQLMVIYIVLVCVRGGLVFLSRPLLRLLSPKRQPVAAADALVMTWGGLRGAVGLALGITVYNDTLHNESSDHPISEKQAREVLFFVSGVAFLTIVVNATTAPAMVRYLGITAMPKASQKMLRKLHEQLVTWSSDQSHPQEVTTCLMKMHREIDHHITKHLVRDDDVIDEAHEDPASRCPQRSSTKTSSEGSRTPSLVRASPSKKRVMAWWIEQAEDYQDNADLIEQYVQVERAYHELAGKSDSTLVLPDLQQSREDMIQMAGLLQGAGVDTTMAKVVNKAFLLITFSNYWKLMDQGDLRPGSPEAEALLASTRQALSPLRADLLDFNFLCVDMGRKHYLGGRSYSSWWKVAPDNKDLTLLSSTSVKRLKSCSGRLNYLIRSGPFNVFITVMIVFNGIYVAVEEAVQFEVDLWIWIEFMFTLVFVLEFVLKFGALGIKYFRDHWNVFDFALVILGIIGFALSLKVQVDGAMSSEARVLRISRVFRVLRFLRVMRLFHARLSVEKDVSMQLADHMHRIGILLNFAEAHLLAEDQLVKYFGGNNRVDESDECEIARCVLQSRTSVCKALEMAIQEEKLMLKGVVEELKWVKKRKKITENLEKFVVSAYQDGAISAREAEKILHPLHKHINSCMKHMWDTHEGIIRKGTKDSRSSSFSATARTEPDKSAERTPAWQFTAQPQLTQSTAADNKPEAEAASVPSVPCLAALTSRESPESLEAVRPPSTMPPVVEADVH